MSKKDNYTKEQNQIKLFIELATHIFVIHYNFRELFETRNSQKIIMKTAPDFFCFINELLIRDFFLETAKLMETENFRRNTKKQNLTVALIVNMTIWNQKQRIVLNGYKEKLGIFTNKIKEARNKIIAHNDLSIYENDTLENLGEFEIGLDTAFINTLEEFCNYIHKEAFGEIWGNFVPNSQGDVQELIGYLYKGKVFHQVIEDASISIEVKANLMQQLQTLQNGKFT